MQGEFPYRVFAHASQARPSEIRLSSAQRLVPFRLRACFSAGFRCCRSVSFGKSTQTALRRVRACCLPACHADFLRKPGPLVIESEVNTFAGPPKTLLL